MMFDIYSRMTAGACVQYTETAALAVDLIAERSPGVPGVVHATRGPSMSPRGAARAMPSRRWRLALTSDPLARITTMQPDRAARAVLSRVVDDIRQFLRCCKPDSRWQWAEWFTYAGSVTADRRPFDDDCLVTAQAGAWRWSL